MTLFSQLNFNSLCASRATEEMLFFKDSSKNAQRKNDERQQQKKNAANTDTVRQLVFFPLCMVTFDNSL